MKVIKERGQIQVQNVKHRQAVAKLPVETGRYKNIPYNDQICKHCDLNEIGNEQHYLMSCSNTMFRTLRNKFIDNLYKINKSLMLFNTRPFSLGFGHERQKYH